MYYHLLTGGTGLLGSYLLRDCLQTGHSIAVLARPQRSKSARQRIDSILGWCEEELGHSLPRPVVLEGDLHQADLGLDSRSRDWVARHCHSVIHNAASLSFHASSRDGEPWISNVEGTRKVLELCQAAKIARLHYVSTAYTCGLRKDRVLESELDVGQEMGNDYEQSKIQAEKMVREADFLDSLTVYRPSIIVGDSQTSFTSTFHGYYAPLKLAHTLVSKLVLGATSGSSAMSLFGLSGEEHKNFVPVDWVSRAMTEILSREELHGDTYHLTTDHPTSVIDVAEVIQDAVEKYSKLATASDSWVRDADWFSEVFQDQMDVYQAYWRDDPHFDSSNTQAALPDLPCPVIDRAMLLRLAKFAIDSNFRCRRFPKPAAHVRQRLGELFQPRNEMPATINGYRYVGLQVEGPGGGDWKILLDDGMPVAVEEGISRDCTATFHLDSETYRRLASLELTAERARVESRMRIQGNGLSEERLISILQSIVAP